jgi:hypothetical protein
MNVGNTSGTLPSLIVLFHFSARIGQGAASYVRQFSVARHNRRIINFTESTHLRLSTHDPRQLLLLLILLQLLVFDLIVLFLLFQLGHHVALLLVAVRLKPTHLIFKVLNALVLLLAQLRHELHVLVSLPELLLQLKNLTLGLVQLDRIWIHILSWYVRDEAGSGGIVERRYILFDELVARR